MAAPSTDVSAGAPYQNRRLQSIESARNIEAKCELLLEWVQRLEQETPPRRGRFVLDRQTALGLYRDEDFAQLFGKPFDQTTPKWRADFHEDVISRCEGRSGKPRPFIGPRGAMTTFADEFRPYEAVLDGPFLNSDITLNEEHVKRWLLRARDARRWMDVELGYAMKAPQTLETIADLRELTRDAPRRLASLWPSEQRHFTTAIDGRKAAIASTLMQAWLSEITQPGSEPATIESARALMAQRDQREQLFEALGEQRHSVVTQVNAAIDSRLAPSVTARVAKLEALPATLTGVVQTLEWRKAFDADLGWARGLPSVRSAENTYAAARQKVVDGALPEWTTAVAAAPLTAEGGEALNLRLGAMFPSDEQGLPTFRTYAAEVTGKRAALTRRLADEQAELEARHEAARAAERVRNAEAMATAAAASRTAANNAAKAILASKRPDDAICDALAAHPEDPGNPTKKGLADDKMPTTAIAPCSRAVAANPASARLQFQLGRAHWAAQRYDEAIEAFLAAEEAGYAPAYYYLGRAHEQGLLDEEPADLEGAAEMYMIAAAEGFPPAVQAYESIEWVTEIGFSTFAYPLIAQSLYEGKTSYLSSWVGVERESLLSYVKGVDDFLQLDPREFADACPKLAARDLSRDIQRLFRVEVHGLPAEEPSNPMQALAQVMSASRGQSPMYLLSKAERIEKAKQGGTDDFYALVSEYGGCSGEPASQFYNNLKGFVAHTAAQSNSSTNTGSEGGRR